MNASKENARKAKRLTAELLDALPTTTKNNDRFRFLADFLDAAERKLPSEKAYTTARLSRKRRSRTAPATA